MKREYKYILSQIEFDNVIFDVSSKEIIARSLEDIDLIAMGCGGSTSNGGEPQMQQHATQTNNNNNKENLNYYSNTDKKRGKNNTHDKENSKSPRRARPYPESKYAASNGSANMERSDDKGYKKRIRNHLIEVTSGTDIDEIEKAMEKFEKNHMEDCGDWSRAYSRVEYLKMKRDLRDAIRRRHVGVLERTIAEARNCPYASQLGPQIEAAERNLLHLRELNQYSHDILAMDQSTISEIHSYHRPPACVHDVMAASYMLLGYNESKLRDWSYVQSLAGRVGRDSLIHQVRDFDTAKVDQRTGERVGEILSYHDLDEVRVASNGAATFHVWASNIVDMIGRDQGQEDSGRQTVTSPPKPSSMANTPNTGKGRK
ncbi:kyphoscoliosis peptidase [Plakobranchus ocellatus]|uniref:Kyphoscoliosis peptidase n=1 Tax=Plakobranchus ocellatus TaxID=259542 RepID=A0AAV4CQX7_9GAST|nr:kyphoscoliosis peptidase [Plakobranchus ocellatus]